MNSTDNSVPVIRKRREGWTLPVVIGLVGGIAAGKSHVGKILREFGAELIEADQIGHEVLARPLVLKSLVRLFGEGIVDDEGGIERSQLAALVFGDSPDARGRRAQLEGLVHPLIHAEAVRALRAIKEAAKVQAVVIDAPLLLEAGWAPMCDVILFVDADDALRVSRAAERGWTAEQLRARESAQLDLDAKRRASTHILDTSADDFELRSTLKAIWNDLIQQARPS